MTIKLGLLRLLPQRLRVVATLGQAGRYPVSKAPGWGRVSTYSK
jgi:hypothetical protein